ncbi:MAG: OmpA family protein [Shimia sp.]
MTFLTRHTRTPIRALAGLGAGIATAAATTCVALLFGAGEAAAHDTGGVPHAHIHGGQPRVAKGERYVPTVWVDPDGCEHWVMDDGWEGFMTLKTDRQGRPTCHRGSVCGVMRSDQFFATNSHKIGHAGQSHLINFFQQTGASGYIIVGHTDSRASDAYNMKLSKRRANAVAHIAHAAGARVVDIRGYGERAPIASNHTKQGMAQNRRVEIICVR